MATMMLLNLLLCVWIFDVTVVSATIENCANAAGMSITRPPIHMCSTNVSYAVDPATTAQSASVEFANNLFDIALSPSATITLDACPNTLTGVTCANIELTLASTALLKDGSEIFVDGVGFPGLIRWKCADSGSNEVNFYFFVGALADTGVDLVAILDTAYTTSGVQSDTTIDLTQLEKFSAIDNETTIYYFQDSTPVYNYVFMSDATSITMKYTGVFANTEHTTAIAATPAADVCQEAVELYHPSGDDDGDDDDDDDDDSKCGSLKETVFIPLLMAASFIQNRFF